MSRSTQEITPDPDALERQHTRQRRSSMGKTIGAFAVVAAIGLASVASSIFGALGGAPESSGPSPGGENATTLSDEAPTVRHWGSLVRIDATTGEIVARVAIPLPKLLASGGRSVWVLGDEGAREKLVRVDVATNSVTGTFDAAEVEATRLAVAGGSVWLGNNVGEVYRLAPGASAGEPVTFAGRDGLANLVGDSLVRAAGALWVSAFPQGPCCTFPPGLYRIDPATGRAIARIDDGGEVVASGTGFVWAVGARRDRAERNLIRIDTETYATVPIGVLELLWADLTVADRAVWASIPVDGAIVRLDPMTGEENGRIRVGRAPWTLAAGAGAVWAAIREDGTVARYDIASDQIETIDVGGRPIDLVFAHDSVWVAVEEASPGEGSPGTSAAAGEEVETGLIGRHRLTVDGVPFSFRVPTVGWEGFGSISINKSIVGPQGAEAIIFWTSFPHGDYADPCAHLLSPSVGPSAADLAAAVSTAPGTELVRGPSDVTVGGRAAKHVVLTVRENVGCDPGFFYTWQDLEVGALWPETRPGDTIRVWIVDAGGTRLFIEAETTEQADSALEQEIQQIVGSISFD
jgi:hypothetical protein